MSGKSMRPANWRGLYSMIPNGFPIIGWSREAQGILTAVGICGHGLMLCPGVRELVTRIMRNEPAPSDYEILEILFPFQEFAGQEKL